MVDSSSHLPSAARRWPVSVASNHEGRAVTTRGRVEVELSGEGARRPEGGFETHAYGPVQGAQAQDLGITDQQPRPERHLCGAPD